jgi:DNA repair and recombination protein RAD52
MDEVDFAVAGDGHPDEVELDNSVLSNSGDGRPQRQVSGLNSHMQPPTRPLARTYSAGNTRPQPQTPNAQESRAGGQQAAMAQQAAAMRQQQAQSHTAQQNGVANGSSSGSSTSSIKPNPSRVNGPPAQNGTDHSIEGAGFFSARAVNHLPAESLNSGPVVPNGGQAFNPHAESPSIRKTPGIDHTTSKPLARNGQHVAPTASQATADTSTSATSGVNTANASPRAPSNTGNRAVPPSAGGQAARGNVVNPQLDQARRIGAPSGGSSPLANRGQYRPPTMKRPLSGEAPGGVPAGGGGSGNRAALTEVSSNAAVAAAPSVAGADVKRQKLS